ncbi:hypothetical protein EDD22DRAFT_983130 [Suillus occidentalis]|nr:hypothetical protein EDD22DRAFT_983130 [Suillus occidentalis]
MAPRHLNKRPKNRTGLTSLKIRHVISHQDPINCGLHPRQEVLGSKQIAEQAAVLSAEEKCALEALRQSRTDVGEYGFDGDNDFGTNVLDGSEPIDISHAGGELQELTQKLVGDFWKINTGKSRNRRMDYRTRRDRTRRHTQAFDNQMSALTDAYMDWHLVHSTLDGRGFFSCYSDVQDMNEGSIEIKVVDVFYTFIASALVRQGVIPCSPISPTTAITMEALNFYWVAHQRNPHFSIQAYMRMLCDLQGVQFYPYLSHQFSIALDVYLQILANVDSLVHQAISRSDPIWRLKHTCPACTYMLKGEVPLKFSLLYTMDGNDSLKQVLKKLDSDDDNDNAPPRSAELPSTQVVRGDRYLSREYVDQFLADSPADMMADEDKDNPCAGRWKNMRDEKTRKMWGVFDESGIFMSACCHGFLLLIADMVQGGEQSKYPLAVVSKLLDTFGKDLGGGYDVGCRFKTTLSWSSLGRHAHDLNHTSLGLGLEDLEGCEHIFSKSNALAASVRYATIANYFQHNDDFEVYANLTTFLYNNYKQALNVLHDAHATLPKLMAELGVTDESIFDAWLAEEHNYLMFLMQEPEHETLHMEYWQRLVNLSGSSLVANRKLQRALDNLEGLVVARIFELSKMNRVGTGYKLWKHIGKALQYNTAAHAMCQASEEILHLNIEICHMATYLRDEEVYLTGCQKQLQSMHPALTHQVGVHHNICARFTSYHLWRLHKISALPGFTGLIAPGESVKEGPGAAASVAAMCIPAKLLPVGPTMMEEGEDEVLQDLEEEEIADADGEEDSCVLEAILQYNYFRWVRVGPCMPMIYILLMLTDGRGKYDHSWRWVGPCR